MQKVALLGLFVGCVGTVLGTSKEKHVRFCDENIQSYENYAKLYPKSSKVRPSRRQSESLNKYKVKLPTLEEIENDYISYEQYSDYIGRGFQLLYSNRTEAATYYEHAFFGNSQLESFYNSFVRTLSECTNPKQMARKAEANVPGIFALIMNSPYKSRTISKDIVSCLEGTDVQPRLTFWQSMSHYLEDLKVCW